MRELLGCAFVALVWFAAGNDRIRAVMREFMFRALVVLFLLALVVWAVTWVASIFEPYPLSLLLLLPVEFSSRNALRDGILALRNIVKAFTLRVRR